MTTLIDEEQRQRLLAYWGPALAAGFCAWLAFMLYGKTPLIRASGLALVIVGVALTLRPWGALLSFLGVMAFAFSPAFWSQTGGADSLSLPAVLGAGVLAILGVLLAQRLLQRRALALVIGLVIFSLLFLLVVGKPGSLRLTTLLAAWVLFLLCDAILVTNPRPDEAAPGNLRARHTAGLLLLLVVGVLNDPLFALLMPAVLLALFLSHARLPRWYWALLLGVLAFGSYGIAVEYMDSGWWLYPAAQAEALGYRTPNMIADGWRAPARWLYLFGMIIEQFTPFGLALGVLGLARMSRWYPPLGVTLMVAYATYFVFGLVYFGRDSAVLLLPLLMIQAVWITYAVHAFGHWLQRSASRHEAVRWLAPAVFTLLPLFLFLRVMGIL
ncbi:MAG: hypothetical protein DIU68_012890 [Chloroflexota bacterium]